MLSTESSRAEAFASQADRSREMAAGHLQQILAVAKGVREVRTAIDLQLRSISVPTHWVGTRLEIQNALGEWVQGPDLLGPGIVSADVDQASGHLVLTYRDGSVADVGQVRPEGDFRGAASSVDGNFVVFDGADGKRGRDGGLNAASFAESEHEHSVDDISDASANGRELMTADDYAAMRVLLSLVKGTSAGNIPVLDGSGKLATSVLPESVVGAMKYQTDWNAATNSPAIPVAATDNKGWYYIVATAGTTSIGGVSDWQIGDWVVSDGTKWSKIDSSDQVNSVAGLTGSISASDLRIALSLVVGTNVQAYSAILAALAGLSPAANKLAYFSGASAMGLADLSTFVRGILGSANDAAFRSAIGVMATPFVAGTPTVVSSAVPAIAYALDASKERTTFCLDNVLPVTAYDTLTIRASLDNGATYTVSAYATVRILQGGQTVQEANTSGTTGVTIAVDINNSDATLNGVCGEITVSQVAGKYATFRATLYKLNSAGGHGFGLLVFGHFATTSTITNISLQFASGNIAKGRVCPLNLDLG